MAERANRRMPHSVAVIAVATWLVLALASLGRAADRLEPYQYEDTRQLVALVEEAAGRLEGEGTTFFEELGRRGSRWFDDNHYFFCYGVDGRCLFHATAPELVGKQLMGLKDFNGKPVGQMVTDIGKKPGRDAAGWVFYLWEEGTQFAPSWKSSYIRKVVMPDGGVVILGSGSYHQKMEKAFVKERVEMAADLLRREGQEAAAREFRDPASPFSFLESYIFVMNTRGRTLVDPAFPTLQGRDLSGFTDAVGRPAVKEMLERMEHYDEAWTQYMWPQHGSSLPARKLMFVKKVKVGEETFIVGSDYFAATPIWMSH